MLLAQLGLERGLQQFKQLTTTKEDKTLLLDELKGLRVRNASEHGQKC